MKWNGIKNNWMSCIKVLIIIPGIIKVLNIKKYLDKLSLSEWYLLHK